MQVSWTHVIATQRTVPIHTILDLQGTGPLCKVTSLSANQEIPCFVCNPKVHCCIHRSQPLFAVLSQINSIHASHPTLWIYVWILSSYLRLEIPGGLSRVFPMPRAPPISFFLIWAPEWYLVGRTDHKAPRYAVFSSPLLARPSYTQMSSGIYSQKPSAWCLPPV